MAALTVINTIPTGSAAARQELWISNAGVVMKYSSHAYSIDGIVKSSKKTKETLRALYCRNERTIGGAIVTKVVIRMCSLRRKATTAPSIASQRNRIDASSSDQTSGLRSRYRATTPANKMSTSMTDRK